MRWDAWGGGATTYTGLDAFGRTSRVLWLYTNTNPDTELVEFAYGYDRNSLPAYLLNDTNDDYSELYGRDGLDRLDDYQRGVLTSNNTAITSVNYRQLWSLDEVANWKTLDQDNTGDGSSSWDLEQTRTHDETNEITGVTNTTGGAWTTPAYDAAGNTTTLSKGGSPSSGLTAAYDAWNRVAKLSESGSAVFTSYEYDARGFRVKKNLHDDLGELDDVRHYYYTTSWQCVEEREKQDPSTSNPPELRTQYVWGLRYVDDLVQRKRDTTGNGTLNETLYALNDRQFNAVALVDTGGSVVQRMLTTPYGQTTFLTANYTSSTNTKNWEHVFQGLRTDAESGLIENRNRVLHPLLGRFLQRDPMGYPDGMNAYAAYHVMWGGMDPSGRNFLIQYLQKKVWPPVKTAASVTLLGLDVAADTTIAGLGAQHAIVSMVRDTFGNEDASFVSHYFFGGGADYNLTQAQGDRIRAHHGLASWADTFEESAISRASRHRFELDCKNNTITKKYSSNTYQDIEGIIFSIGGADFNVEANCIVQVINCMCIDDNWYPTEYVVECNFSYELDDVFEDPVDVFGIIPGMFEVPGGDPFRIVFNWQTTRRANGLMPLPGI